MEEVGVAEAAAVKGVVDDLAAHLAAVQLSQRADLGDFDAFNLKLHMRIVGRYPERLQDEGLVPSSWRLIHPGYGATE